MDAAQEDNTASFVYRNALDLPRIRYEDVIANTAEGVFVETPREPVRRRRPAAFHDDPDGARLFPDFAELEVASPPVFTISLCNARLVGFRSLLSRDGMFLNDVPHLSAADVTSFLKELAGTGESIAPLQVADEAGKFTFTENPAAPRIHLTGPVVVLASAEPGNFGSFIYRDLVKLINLDAMPTHWRFLAYIGRESFGQFLELAGLPMERVIRHDPKTIYEIDQAIVPGLRNPVGLFDEKTRMFYEKLRMICADGTSGRRLYVSRYSMRELRPGGRVMLNEAELIERLRAIGFDIVEPQRLSAAQQVATFAAADLVVGPSGAGMFNAVFCRPGTKLIDIESEPHWAYPHSCLFSSAGLNYGIFEGLAADRDWSIHHKPWRVNIDALLARIADLCSA